MENDIKEITCVGCGSKQKFLFAKKNNFSYYRCADCKMISLYKVPKSYSDIYDSEYFSGGSKGFGYVNYDEDKEPMRVVFFKYLDLIKYISKKTGKLFDVGAATGFFVDLAQKKGFIASGVEISEYAVKLANSKGLDLKTGTLESILLEPGHFDVITMLDVLEHLPDPEKSLRIVNKLLKTDGLVIINTPNSGSFFARLTRKNWHLLVPPEHIHLFNKVGVMELLKRSGFKIIKITHINKSFTLEYIFNMLFKWLGINSFQKIAIKIKGTRVGRVSLPVDFHDNMFVIAQKNSNENNRKV
jgi:2-polyprenyl-3-methyl-5-hydroxy-6-metoxy-1,4-benzoquinol methylase